MKTVEEVLDSLEFLEGNDKRSCVALRWLNEARELLWSLGDFPGTIDYICRTLPQNGCFYLPWYAKSIKRAWSCKDLTISSENWRRISHSDLSMCNQTQDNIIPTGEESPIPCDPGARFQIGFQARDSADKGKEVHVGAITTGNSRESVSVSLGGIDKIVYADIEIKKILGMSKTQTTGRVDVFVNVPDPKCEYLVSFLDPNQTTARHAKYKSSLCHGTCCVIQYKKRFIKFSADDLYMEADIDNSTALALAMDAIKLRQERRYADSGSALKLAKGFIEVEREDLRPKAMAAIIPSLPNILS